MIDDLTVLHQLDRSLAPKKSHLFRPMDSYRTDGYQNKNPKGEGMNHPGGVTVHYLVPDLDTASTTVKMAFLEKDGQLIREFSNKAKDKKDQLTVKPGANTFTWNLRYEDAKDFKGMILWWASMSGPRAVPGEYKVRLTVGDDVQEESFQILPDPRSPANREDFKKQFDFLLEIRDKVSEAHLAIGHIKDARSQLKAFTKRLDKEDDSLKPIFEKAEVIDSMITEVEEALYQTKNQARQDPLNFPIKLTNKLAHITSLTGGDYPPTDQAVALKNELTAEIDGWLNKLDLVKTVELPAFNKMIRESGVDVIQMKEE